MDWPQKILQGSSENVRERDYPAAPSDVRDELDDRERDDTDHVVALSLSEEEQKQQVIDNETCPVDEEHLAQKLQGVLKADFAPQQCRPNLWSLPSFFPTCSMVCARCHNVIGNEGFVSGKEGLLHLGCFRCHSCDQPITDYQISISGGHPYHKSCYWKYHQPKCDVCKQPVPCNYTRGHPFWDEKLCPSHWSDGTPLCCSCDRMEPRDTRYVSLGDGRKLCLECLDSSIMNTEECQPLYQDIKQFYEGLDMKLGQEFPLLLVDKQTINEGHFHHGLTLGKCFGEEKCVKTFFRGAKVGAGNQITNLTTGPFRLSRRVHVTAIMILFGLPRLLTGAILAHEMMHAWLRLNGYRYLIPEVEEGICQVMGHMWLTSEIMSASGRSNGASSSPSSSSSSSSSSSPSSSSSSSSSSSPREARISATEMKLDEFFLRKIELNASPIYGEGFRVGNRAVLKYGLRPTLEHIRLTGRFPV